MRLPHEPKALLPQRAARPIGDADIAEVLSVVRKHVKQYDLPIVTFIASTEGDPFKVLISTMLSLRTKDLVTAAASERLFGAAKNPAAMLALPASRIERLIYPVGFYRTKAKAIRETCRVLIAEHGGKVPADIDALIRLPGVGRKTANLVMSLGYGKHAICVDTHVHRISNIWGYVRSRTPHETEMQLRERLPRKYWIEYNDLLVSFGQHTCVPVSPKCTSCPLLPRCPRIGVVRNR